MADRRFTHEDLRTLLVERVGIDPGDARNDGGTTFEELGLDSLGFMEIQADMEQRYDIEVTADDADGIVTLDDAVAFVNRRLAEKETV